MVKVLLVVLVFLGIVACSTPEQRAQMVIEKYGPYCEKLGYNRETDNWRDCLMREHKRITDIAIGVSK